MMIWIPLFLFSFGLGIKILLLQFEPQIKEYIQKNLTSMKKDTEKSLQSTEYTFNEALKWLYQQ